MADFLTNLHQYKRIFFEMEDSFFLHHDSPIKTKGMNRSTNRNS